MLYNINMKWDEEKNTFLKDIPSNSTRDKLKDHFEKFNPSYYWRAQQEWVMQLDIIYQGRRVCLNGYPNNCATCIIQGSSDSHSEEFWTALENFIRDDMRYSAAQYIVASHQSDLHRFLLGRGFKEAQKWKNTRSGYINFLLVKNL